MFHRGPDDGKKSEILEKHLKFASQINLKMESLQTKIEELDRWRNMEKSVPSGLMEIKAYDIRLQTLVIKALNPPNKYFIMVMGS